MSPSPEHEMLEIVDKENRVTGVRDRAEIHRQGLWHRSVHIFIFNSRGEIYLQKRSPRKDQYPEHWDSSAAGHLIPGESPEIAAHRELGEELGIDAELTEVYRHPACQATGWEFVTLFVGRTDEPIHLNLEEATEGRFFTAPQLTDLLEDPDQKVAPGFRLLHQVTAFHLRKAAFKGRGLQPSLEGTSRDLIRDMSYEGRGG
jgi:isopentenyl-diphosphate delta-isomerase type 1